ncbi:MAG: EscU/YscU/HrcU family type III secretion system export apparatus switch protein [Oscillospiraceae bacterium]|nr:EscU/YscU/HrcU family type III secretion system export apparatus switch protein [Oscillospiraceae bacterium]
MSRSDSSPSSRGKRAVALQYGADDAAPVVVASGMGYLAEKIVDVALDNGVPIYEDDSLATVLAQLNLGQEIPQELYQAIVEIYVYFLNFDPSNRESMRSAPAEPPAEEPADRS